jgi:putative tributyrin esterase
MLRLLLILALLLVAVSSRAGGPERAHGSIERDTIWSPALGVRKQVVVYLPPSYDRRASATQRYPVALYLHGRWGDETDLVTKGALAASMDSLIAAGMPDMIVVMPDGDDGWWTTWALAADTAACRREPHREEAPADFCVVHPRYDAYLVEDVITHVDATYRTLARRESRGVGGLSMGGYGAFALAARYPALFGAAASHGGVITPGLLADTGAVRAGSPMLWRSPRNTDELKRATGFRWDGMYPTFGLDPQSWAARAPATLLAASKASGAPVPALYADVALDDETVWQNRVFREAMGRARIPLLYAEWDGEHTWDYWRLHVPDGLQFFSTHLDHRQ